MLYAGSLTSRSGRSRRTLNNSQSFSFCNLSFKSPLRLRQKGMMISRRKETGDESSHYCIVISHHTVEWKFEIPQQNIKIQSQLKN